MLQTKQIPDPSIMRGFVFRWVFGESTELVKRLIELVLEKEISEIQVVHPEHSLDVLEESRAGRLDVWVKDVDGNEYDIEVQKQSGKYRGEPEWLRARYYHTLMTATSLAHGVKVEQLKDSVVVFLCDFDPFKEGLARYDCCTMCAQTGQPVDDRLKSVYLYTKGNLEGVSPELGAFLRYAGGEQVDDDVFVEDIKHAIDVLVANPQWMEEYMTLEEEIEAEKRYAASVGREEGLREGREEGREEGLSLGRAEGRAEGRVQMADENARLAQALEAADRAGELVAALMDPAVRERLLAEFGIASQVE